MKRTLLFVIGSALSVSAFAQTGPQQAIALVPLGSMPVFVVTETSRNVEAVDYQHRSGASEVDLAGTALLPSANHETAHRRLKSVGHRRQDQGIQRAPAHAGPGAMLSRFRQS